MTLEFRIAKKPGSAQLELIKDDGTAKTKAGNSGGGKKFADLLWPDRVLIEMKKRGEKLEQHYRSALRLLELHRPATPAFRDPL